MAKKRAQKRPPARPQGSKSAAPKQQQPRSPSKAAPTAKAPAKAASPAAKAPPSAKAAPSKPAPKPTRAERIEAAQRERRRRRLLVRALWAGAVLVVVAVIAGVVINNRRASDRTVRRLEAGGCQFDRRSDPDAGQGRNHVPSPQYRVDPPAGGNHIAQAAPPGDYGANPPPDGQLVHALEHGDIVLWHRPDAGEDVLGPLREIADRYDGDVLIVSRPSLPTTVAATAWHRRLLCSQPDARALDLFVATFRDKGPEDVEEQGS